METAPPPLISGSGLPGAPPIPLSEGLDRTIRHCIIMQLLLTCASKAFSCLVVLVAGKFYSISSLKIFDYLCASSADETEYKLSDNLV